MIYLVKRGKKIMYDADLAYRTQNALEIDPEVGCADVANIQ